MNGAWGLIATPHRAVPLHSNLHIIHVEPVSTTASCGDAGASNYLPVTYCTATARASQNSSSSTSGANSTHHSPGVVAIAVAALWGFDKLVLRVLQRLGSRLPSSIAAMLLCVGGLIVVQAVKGTETADRLASFVQPGVVFLGRWLLSFLTCVPLATCAADAPHAGL